MNWVWEIGACYLVLTTPIIIFATLYPYSGRPLPQWPFKASINSLLSVYALIFKAAIGFILTSCIGQLQWTWFSKMRPLTDMLHFDNATRGADGALGLIWRQRFQQPLTALGALIMVLTVTVDPFVQQLVVPVDCSIEVSGGSSAATLPRINVFEELEYYDVELEADVNVMLRKATESALYNAFFSPGQDPPWQCPTGNCTFTQAYGTIGVCYSCQDASAHVSVTATCSNPNASYASHHPKSLADCPVNSRFTVESNFTAGKYIKLGTKMTIPTDYSTLVVADASSEVIEYETSGSRSHGILFGFLLGAAAASDWATPGSPTCDSNGSQRTWGCQDFGAATCSLQHCVQSYNATISAGVLEENLVASSADTAWGMIYDKRGTLSYFAMIDTQCFVQNQTSSPQIPTTESRWVPYNVTLADWEVVQGRRGGQGTPPLSSNAKSLLDRGCLYLMSPADEIMHSLSTYLTGTVHTGGLPVIVESETGSAIFGSSGFEGPGVIPSIYNWGHTDFNRIQSIFANISNSFTTYIRTHGSPNNKTFSKDAHGEVYHYATCLELQWPWISFLAILALLTAVFFLTVVEATIRQGKPIWKASPLAWILRADGLDNANFRSSTRLREGMKEGSEQIAVHLLDKYPDGPHICLADIKDPILL